MSGPHTDDVISDITNRGYWRVVIRPGRFNPDRVPFKALEELARRSSVQLRGWDLPHIDPHTPIHRDVDWVGQTSAWEHHLESWRLFTSGQFYLLAGMWIDWRDRSTFWPPDHGWAAGRLLGVFDALYRYTEVFELAARLALSEAGDDAMHVEVSAHGLANRILYIDSNNRVPFAFDYKATIATLPYAIEVPRDELVADARTLAIAPARALFLRFGWDPSEEQLREAQHELRRS